MSRYCEQCGEKLAAGENFCPSCGTKVIIDEPPSQPSTPAQKTSFALIPDDSLGKLIMGILGGMGIIFFIVMFTAGSSSQKYTSERYDSPSKTSAPADTKPKTPAALNEADLSISNNNRIVALNANKSYIDGQFGGGRVQSDGWYDYGDFWAKFDSTGRINWLSCMSANLSTSRGIHVGSTLADLERAYNINQFRKEIADITVNYECDFRDMTLIFSVLKSSNRVDQIVLVKKVQEPKPPAEKPKPPTEKPKPPAEKPKPSTFDEYNYSCTVNGEKTYKGIVRRGLACALYSVEKQKHITSDYGVNCTARGTFYIVTAIVDNNTNEPIFVPSIYLIDERGRKFSSDINATSTYTVVYNIESAVELNPNQPGWVYEVFDIPDDATITNLRCETSFSLDDNEFNIPFRVVAE